VEFHFPLAKPARHQLSPRQQCAYVAPLAFYSI
jgi:hypothetical protein